MSYLSTTENVGFSGIPQNIPETSCATQYKMAVEGVSGNCGEVMFISDSSVEDQNYITHLNDNYYTKFKIDPNDLITFHDSDVIAGEITVSHTEDDFMFPDNVDVKAKFLDSPSKELDILAPFTNGDIKKDVKKKVLSNGHYPPISKPIQKETKPQNTKVQKSKQQVKEVKKELVDTWKNVNSPKNQSTPTSGKNSINSTNTSNGKGSASKQASGETFLDVFKREQGLVEGGNPAVDIAPPPPPPPKTPSSPPKKSSSAKNQSQSKPRRGRGPAVHEALQRISSQRVIPVPNTKWHAPGDNLFDCGPLDNKTAFRQFESSSDDDSLPDFESGNGPVCVEETAAESRGARLALRRAALRRHVARAHASLKLVKDHREQKVLASIIKKQLSSPGSSGHLPTQTVNHVLAMRGMPALLNTQERRRLRESGWSGGESSCTGSCIVEQCGAASLPLARHCVRHVAAGADQRLYAPCAAVFAGGARCNQPLLLLRDQTPLCAEHAWKRDNYDKLKDIKSKKLVRARAPPRRPPRRRRPPPRPRPALPPHASHSLSEINVCSNSSAYDSSEEPGMGALSENEYITVPVDSHDLEVEVGHVAPDDILDPAVLSQIPDEAFTEFFNQGIVLAEGGSTFGESSELAAALEAVLDERDLDDRGLSERALAHAPGDNMDMFHTEHMAKDKMEVSPSAPLEMPSSASS